MASGTKWLRGKKNQGPQAKRRRVGALSRLMEHLKADIKELYTSGITGASELWMNALKSNIKRQEKEIAILQERV